MSEKLTKEMLDALIQEANQSGQDTHWMSSRLSVTIRLGTDLDGSKANKAKPEKDDLKKLQSCEIKRTTQIYDRDIEACRKYQKAPEV